VFFFFGSKRGGIGGSTSRNPSDLNLVFGKLYGTDNGIRRITNSNPNGDFVPEGKLLRLKFSNKTHSDKSILETISICKSIQYINLNLK
jgi:hypothetical protein